MRTRKQIVQAAIQEGIDRKNDLQELGLACSKGRNAKENK